MRVAYVYAKPRQALQEAIARGEAPDTGLLGQNHLADFGVKAEIRDSLLRKRHRAKGLAHRLTWSGRELTLPLELRRYDAICTTIGPTLPLTAKATFGPRVVLFNMSLCQSIARSSGAKRSLLAAGVRTAGAVVCFAEAQRDRLLELTGADPERVHVVGLGVDARFLATDAPPPPGGMVLAAGRDLGRDYATFAAAVDGLDVPVVLVASERNLKGISLPANVELRVDVSPVELRELYEQAAFVVVPTRREGYPLGADCSGQTVVLDAFAMSRPVIASERSTLRGYVEDGRNGLIVSAEDAAALRQAIAGLAEDPALAQRLGEEGRRDVEARFTTRALAEGMSRILRRERPAGRDDRGRREG